jgi:predicted acyl esterase
MKQVTLSLLFLILAVAQSVAGNYYPLTIPMRDGKSLAADLYSSDSNLAKPVILVQTPYNKNLYRLAINLPPQAGGTFPYDSIHYNYVILDWRGFYGSTSAAVAGYDRGLDGYDAVEWIAGQRWCDGKVGTWGPSALGAIQFMTAKHRPPHLICCVPLVKDFKTKYSDFYCGGDYRREHVTTLQTLGLTDTTLILAHPTEDLLWQGTERLSDYPDSIAVPMLLVSGWFDHFPDDVIRAFADLRARSAAAVRARHRLIMGPWMHEAVDRPAQGDLEFPNAVGIADSTALAFFDHYLRSVANGYEAGPVVRYYQMGTNEWRTTEDWYGLPGKGDTLRLNLTGDRKLSLSPAAGPVADTIRFDPRNPSPSTGGARLVPPGSKVPTGPRDQRDSVESRPDVLVYSTEPLAEDIAIDGGTTLQLFVSSDRYDTDISLRLCDLYPDGRSILLAEGIRRMRFREGFRPQDTAALVPGQVYPVTIGLQNLGMTFLKGHRIRLDISSSDYPQFDINPNTGGKLYAPDIPLVATNLVYHSTLYPSRILLPVVPSGSSSVERAEATGKKGTLEEIRPDPFSSHATVAFHLSRPAYCLVELYDLLGNRVATILHERLDEGEGMATIDGTGLRPGTYICRMQIEGTVEQRVVRLVR